MRGVRGDFIEAATTAISRSGLTGSVVEKYSDMVEVSVSAGGTHVGMLDIIFRKDRFDAHLWSADGHILGGRSGVGYGRVDDHLWLIADIERALRVAAVRHLVLPSREIPSDFVLGMLVSEVSRLPLKGEESHAWCAVGPLAHSLVREARDIIRSGGFDRERFLRFAKILADALPNLDAHRDGRGIIMMARRSLAAFEGRPIQRIYDHQWASRTSADELIQIGHAPVHERDAEARSALPTP